jgi:asparagine synthase (glutamine-hydrolysing)
MCGIFAHFSNTEYDKNQCSQMANKCAHRGPDNTQNVDLGNGCMIFHRLAVNDLSQSGNQPFKIQTQGKENNCIYAMCNGEIYNSKQLIDQYQLPVTSNSDCEVIPHLYAKLGIEQCIKLLDGYFAIVIYDQEKQRVYVARDRFGVRSLYIDYTEGLKLTIASEMKSLIDIQQSNQYIPQFPPRSISHFSVANNQVSLIETTVYYQLPSHYNDDSEEVCMEKIRTLFRSAIKKRLQSDRPIGCFLSGGFDSSLVADNIVDLLKEAGSENTLKTFSTGMVGSTDLYHAKIVANAIGSIHYQYIDTREDMLADLPNTVYECETYDPTSVRASTPMRRLSYKIAETTDVVVVFSGEGSDEASGSYLYFHNTPSPDAFQEECKRLLNDLHYFDLLRGDKSTACAGLEIRVPFLDNDFIDYYMTIRPELKVPRNGIEKYLIRKAFSGHTKLPDSILWRTKEAFSDGVSSQGDSWHQMIKDFVKPRTEAEYYKSIFDSHFPNQSHSLPYTWLPKWCGDIMDPSARELSVYKSKPEPELKPELKPEPK